jgi:putative ABC transport system ATP-binding protein
MTDSGTTGDRDDTVVKPSFGPEGMPVVLCRGLNYHYEAGRLRYPVLFDVSLTIGPGEVVLLTGPSGSGKTTLLRLIAGLLQAQDGHLQVLGTDMEALSPRQRLVFRRQLGFIFPGSELIPSLSIAQNIEVALHHERLPVGERRRRVEEALQMIGLNQRSYYSPRHLSGGQHRRVAIARAFVHRPRLILANDPTAGIDRVAQGDITHMLLDVARTYRTTVVVMTQDREVMSRADRVIALENGRVTHAGKWQQLPPWA